MNRRIIGFAGPLASGKGEATRYLEKNYGARRYRFSTILRDLLDRLSLEHSRFSTAAMSTAIRSAFGDDILARAMVKDVERDQVPVVVLDGIRRESDMIPFRNLTGFVFVYIDANERARYERLVKRGENVDDRTKTFKKFLEDQQNIETEITIPPLKRLADVVIDNSGTEKELFRQLDALMNRYGH